MTAQRARMLMAILWTAALTTTAIGDTIDAGRGPIEVEVPSSYDPSSATPVVIALHGYTSTGPDIEGWMQLGSLVDEFGFLYLYPTGQLDAFGNPYWNATDACCDFFGGDPDDSGYLRAVIETMQATYNVDARRIHFVGHSNGGFMSYRMACDHADLVASLVSLAGATYLNAVDCTPSMPVHTLQIHGTADNVIAYGGGCIPFGGCYPGAVATATQWAVHNGCGPDGTVLPTPIDVDASIAGDETTVTDFSRGCEAGGSATLWTIAGGPHSPILVPDFNRLVIEYLFDHPKPSSCPADIDGSGDVAFDDLLGVLANWGPCPGCPEDLDGDGVIGFQDLLTVLAAWGPCGG